MTRRAMICCRMSVSGLVMSTSTSGLFTWLVRPSFTTSGKYLDTITSTNFNHLKLPCAFWLALHGNILKKYYKTSFVLKHAGSSFGAFSQLISSHIAISCCHLPISLPYAAIVSFIKCIWPVLSFHAISTIHYLKNLWSVWKCYDLFFVITGWFPK